MASYLRFIRDNARWIGGGFLLTFFSSFGQTFFISLSGAEIRSDFNLSHGEFGGIYMVATLASAATLPFLGRLVDITTVSRTLLIVIPMLAIATASMAVSQSIALLVLTIYLLRLFGQGMMSHTAVTAMGRWYTGHRGRAVSLVSLGHQGGEAVLPLLTIVLFTWFGWRQTWLISSVILILLALPVTSILMSVERKPQHNDAPERRSSVVQWRRDQVIRDPLFWRLISAVLAPSFIGTAIFFHQDYLVTLRDWPTESFAKAFSVMAAITVTCSLITGQLVDRFSGVRLLPYFLLPLGCGCFVIWNIQAVVGIYLFMALLGCSYGMSSVLFGALWPELYGTAHLGAIRSLVTALMVFSSALGPGVTGWLIDAGVPYTLQLLVLGCYCLLASALMFSLRKAYMQR